MNIENRVVELLNEVSNGLPENYTGVNLFEAGVLDSLAVMQMITLMDDIFDIEIDVDDVTAENFNTVDSIMNLIKKYK